VDILSLNTIFLLLLYVPGYIFIRVTDHFLLKREKSQFEITIQGLAASILIFVIFILCKYQLFNAEKEKIIKLWILALYLKNHNGTYVELLEYKNYIAVLYLLLCGYSFLFALLYSIIRRRKRISVFIEKITGRDYFQSVEMGFYYTSLGKRIIITLDNGTKYLGYLEGAPDNDNDKDRKIIIYNPRILENAEWLELQADRILLDTNKITSSEIIE
jgi:hypothetical protein